MTFVVEVGSGDDYDRGAEDGRADRQASFDGFFRHLLSLAETRRFAWKQHRKRWVVECEGWAYSDYEVAYLVAFVGGNPYGVR